MKNWVISSLLLIFLSMNAAAVSTTLKSSYLPGETIIAEISGNILQPIEKTQVELKRGHITTPSEYDLKRLGDRYFIWAIAPNTENNYTLIIKDIVTTVSGKTESIHFEQNFSVTGNLTDYFIKPGFIFTREDFAVEIQLNEDSTKKITVDFPFTKEILLKPGKNLVQFSLEESNASGFLEINIGKYIFPIYIIRGSENETMQEKSTIFLEPKAIISTTLIKDNLVYPFKIINSGDKSISNLTISYNTDIFKINTSESIKINTHDFVELSVKIISPINEEMKKNGINEFIKVKIKDAEFDLPITIRFTENKSEEKTPYLENGIVYYCKELRGTVCSAEEICDGNIQATIDGACCIGSCNPPQTKGSKSWIGYLIVGIVLILIVFIFLKYKRTKVETNQLDKKVTEAEKKFLKPWSLNVILFLVYFCFSS